jgi:hypothetical protein
VLPCIPRMTGTHLQSQLLLRWGLMGFFTHAGLELWASWSLTTQVAWATELSWEIHTELPILGMVFLSEAMQFC